MERKFSNVLKLLFFFWILSRFNFKSRVDFMQPTAVLLHIASKCLDFYVLKKFKITIVFTSILKR